MEAVPRLPMISFELKTSPDRPPTDFSKLKQYIREFYNEDPESYSGEVRNLETLRSTAVRPVKDVAGCQVLKKYFSQLHFLQSRFPMAREGSAAVEFSWKDIYSGATTTASDVKLEMVSILYNIGALHSQLGAREDRSLPEGLKLACTHFQCAAWAFQHLKDSFPQPPGTDLSPDVMHFKYHFCLAQAQECILEKSMTDNRKATINAKVAAQIVDYYNLALNTLVQAPSDVLSEGAVLDVVGSKPFKSWKKYIRFKVAYYACVSLLYQGTQSEEQQKMGERVAYYQGALDKLNEAIKLSKGVDKSEAVTESLVFTRDVVEGKRKAAKNENEFIYHENIPDLDSLPHVKGASLVKGTPFNVNDPDISGPDIFSRLVPMKAHEASSMYSEEKAKLLRKISALIDAKDEELVGFISCLQLDHLNAHLEPPLFPQEIVDRCASLSAKPDAIPNLISAMEKLTDTSHQVEAVLTEIMELIRVEEAAEKEYQEIMGPRPPSIVATDLTREAHKYLEVHKKAAESNETLHRAMTQHIENLRALQQPFTDIEANLPNLAALNLNDDSTLSDVIRLVEKVGVMRRQRGMLASQLRESICSDDITSQLVVRVNERIEDIFTKELEKHDNYVTLIEQNLAAQDNILRALTEAYANYAPTRKATSEVMRQRELMLSALISSYDAYEDLIAKSSKGQEFYRKLETNLSKLLQRVKGTCRVQTEERETILGQNAVKAQKIALSGIASLESSSPGLRLKDYLNKRQSSAVSSPALSPAAPTATPYYATGEGSSQPAAPSPDPTLTTSPYYAPGGASYQPAAPSSVPAPTTSPYYAAGSISSQPAAPSPDPAPTASPYYAAAGISSQSTTQPSGRAPTDSPYYTAGNLSHPHSGGAYYSTSGGQADLSMSTYVGPDHQRYLSSYDSYYGGGGVQGLSSSNAYNSVWPPQPPSTDTSTAALWSTSGAHYPAQQATADWTRPTAATSSYPSVPSWPTTDPSQPSWPSTAESSDAATNWTPQTTANHSTWPQLNTSSSTWPTYPEQPTSYLATASPYNPAPPQQHPSSAYPTYSTSYDYSNTYPTPQFQNTAGTQQSSYYSSASSAEQTSSTMSPVGNTPYPSNYSNSSSSSGGGGSDAPSYYVYPYGLQGYTSSGHAALPPPTDQATNLARHNSVTYIQASNNGGGGGGVGAQSSTSTLTSSQQPQRASNVDLLAGLDFTLTDAPLLPHQPPQDHASRDTPRAANHSQQQPDDSITTPPSASPAATAARRDKPSEPDKSDKMSVPTKLNDVERPSPSLTPNKDPFADADLLDQFVIEVEKYEKFVDGLNSKTLNGPTTLDLKWNELQDLQDKDSHKLIISVARCYPMKNRFADILPYDTTRVELPSTKDDYINASRVTDLGPGCPNFIVTQAPLKSTHADFWTMILEQHVELIICLMAESQMGGDGYWAVNKGQDMIFGKTKVSLQSCNSRTHWTERIFTVSNGKASKVVIHLEFTSWPNSWLPESPKPLLSLVEEMFSVWSQQRGRGPVVVHCDAGVGRSGVFVVISQCLVELKLLGHLPDVISLTALLAKSRKNPLRDRQYLQFTYQCLLYYAQDLLMKRGILTSRSSFEETRSKTKSHTRHPSEDFLLNVLKDNSDKEIDAGGGSKSIGNQPQETDPLSQIDVLWPIKRYS